LLLPSNPGRRSGCVKVSHKLLVTLPVVRNNGMANDQQYTPIASLNPYANRWTIKARITNKGDIRTWSNARGEGSLFSLDLLDSSGVDIKATFFKEAVDKFYNILVMDNVYTFSGGRIKAANVQYNTCKSPHELSFDQNSEIHQVADGEDSGIAKQSFERIPIAKLSEIEPNSFVDLVGIVKSASDCQSLISKKTQKELFKADLVLVDESCTEINVTVWGEKAKSAAQDYAGQPVVGFKRLKLGDYGGRSCSVSGGPIIINPSVPETPLLTNWWNSQGRSTTVKSLSGGSGGMSGASRMDPLEQRKVLRDIKGDHLGFGEKPDYICVKGLFTFFKIRDEGPWYTACANPDPPCNNRCKATMTSDQSWHCERCGQTRDTCSRRYILSATIADDSCTTWVSMFNEQVMEVIGQELTADLLYDKYFAESSNPEVNPIDDFNAIFNRSKFTEWVFKLKVKNEDVGGETRTKVTIYSLVPVDYVKESREMIDAIAKMQ
jgi:replication factor A1